METYGGGKHPSLKGGVLAIGTYRDPLRAYLRYSASYRELQRPMTVSNMGTPLIVPIASVQRIPDAVMSRYIPTQGSGLIGIIEFFSARPLEFLSGTTLTLLLPRPVSVPVNVTLYGDAGFEATELPVTRVTSTEMVVPLPPHVAECSAVTVAVDGT